MSIIQGVIGSIQGGGGSYRFAQPGEGSFGNSYGVSISSQGTPYDPGNGSLYNPPNSCNLGALKRRAYKGLWNNGSSASDDNPSIFNGTALETVFDDYVAFDVNTGTDNYCFEWLGYYKATSTDTWNFACTADDTCMIWLGSSAINPNNNNWLCNSHYYSGINNNSVSLIADTYYPIRIRFQEWGGGEIVNVWSGVAGTDPTTMSYRRSQIAYNPNSNGF